MKIANILTEKSTVKILDLTKKWKELKEKGDITDVFEMVNNDLVSRSSEFAANKYLSDNYRSKHCDECRCHIQQDHGQNVFNKTIEEAHRRNTEEYTQK